MNSFKFQQKATMDSDNPVYGADPFRKKNSAMPKTMHGHFYQVKLCMWYLTLFIRKGIDFQISSEWTEGGKFNDLVFRYNVSGREFMIFLQAKHKLETTKYVSYFKKENLDQYFESYLKIMQNERFRKTEKWFIFSTNINVSKLVEFELTMKEENDGDMNDKDKLIAPLSPRYRFGENKELSEHFGKHIDDDLSYNVLLAETLTQNLNKTITAAKHEMLVMFRKFLCTYVFTTTKNKKKMEFRSFFIHDQYLERAVRMFRTCLVKVLKTKHMEIKNLRMCFIRTDDDYFASTIEQLKEDEFPSNRVHFKNIENFYDRFLFIVTPNEEELDHFITIGLSEIFKTSGNESNASDIVLKNAFDKLFYYLLNWMKQMEANQINMALGKKIINDIMKDVLVTLRPSLEDGFRNELRNLQQQLNHFTSIFNQMSLTLLEKNQN